MVINNKLVARSNTDFWKEQKEYNKDEVNIVY